jgi:ribosomal protein S18 acetylase RimI-like enzyme
MPQAWLSLAGAWPSVINRVELNAGDTNRYTFGLQTFIEAICLLAAPCGGSTIAAFARPAPFSEILKTNDMQLLDLTILQADYADATHADAIVDVLETYACDPMGGDKPLSDYTKANLVAELAARASSFSVLAFAGNEPIGLVNCIEGFSTFACRPLVNIHDVAVIPAYRGLGVATQMLALVEQIARTRGACKLTLEVLEGNQPASRLYAASGFDVYQLDPAKGRASFLQKWLD